MGQCCFRALRLMRNEHLLRLIRTIPDVPQPGIMFRDITPLLASPEGFAATVQEIVAVSEGLRPTKVVGVEARGFILAAPVAQQLGAGFVPVRKAGKLPWQVVGQSYSLEYGTDRLEMHQDAVGQDDQVLIVDDVLATGGTAAATIRLVESSGATVAGLVFLIELETLNARAALDKYAVQSLMVL